MTATAYIQSLERKLGELETLLKDQKGTPSNQSVPPRSGTWPMLQSESLSAAGTPLEYSPRTTTQTSDTDQGQPGATEHAQVGAHQRAEDGSHGHAQAGSREHAKAGASRQQPADEDIIETMVDVNEKNRPANTPGSSNGATVWDSHRGSFAGLSLLRRVHNLCRHVSGQQQQDNGTGGDPLEDEDDLTHAFDIAPPDADSSLSWEAFALLPAKDKVEQAIDIVIDSACCNLQFLDREVLSKVLDDVYEETDGEMTSHARKPLALLYAVLALSRRYDNSVPPPPRRTQEERTING